MRWQAIEYGLPHPPAYHRYIMKATTTALRSGFFLVWRLDIGLRVVSEDGHSHRYSNNIIATFLQNSENSGLQRVSNFNNPQINPTFPFVCGGPDEHVWRVESF